MMCSYVYMLACVHTWFVYYVLCSLVYSSMRMCILSAHPYLYVLSGVHAHAYKHGVCAYIQLYTVASWVYASIILCVCTRLLCVLTRSLQGLLSLHKDQSAEVRKEMCQSLCCEYHYDLQYIQKPIT
jgi:hypothetical protein